MYYVFLFSFVKMFYNFYTFLFFLTYIPSSFPPLSTSSFLWVELVLGFLLGIAGPKDPYPAYMASSKIDKKATGPKSPESE